MVTVHFYTGGFVLEQHVSTLHTMMRRLKLFVCFVLLFVFFPVAIRIAIFARENKFADPHAQSPHRGITAHQTYPRERRRITLDEVYRRFNPKTLGSCRNKCNVKKNPACQAKTYSEWDQVIAQGQVTGIPLYGAREYMFDYERAYMNRLPKLTDKKTLPDLTRSEIYHVDSKVGQVVKKSIVSCHHMEQLTFRVDFMDGYGNQRRRGGDEVRAWIKGNPQSSNLYDYSATGQVEDLKNGSYLATVTCVWTGYATLMIGLAYPWEYIRASLRSFRLGAHLMLTGTFRDGSVEESTLCSSHANVPGRPCLCNFTHWNELPFYCGKPLDKRLACKDLRSTQTLYPIPKRDLTKTELAIDKEMARLPLEMLVKQKVDIIVEGPTQPLPKTPCSKMKKSDWWRKDYPRGYWSRDKNWTSLLCHEPKLTKDWVEECLANSTVWFIGDSNTGLLYKGLRHILGCPESEKKSFVCNQRKNIKMSSRGHEYPFYSSSQKTLRKVVGVQRFINGIQSSGKHQNILLIHYYLHPTRTHPGALYLSLKKLKQTIGTFLKRNPRARVFLRGPHITTYEASRNHMLGGDVLAAFHLESFYRTFHDLRRKVTFVDGWDMSIAIENPNYHPRQEFTFAMIRTFLSSMC